MLNLGKVFLAAVMSIVFVHADSVKATVSTQEVVLGNSVKFEIEATGDDVVFPDIQQIEGQVIEGTYVGSSSAYSYINGKTQSQRTAKKTFIFVPENDITIPSYEVSVGGKTYKTDPITIKIRKSTPAIQQNGAPFSLQMKADKTKVMAGESLIVTVYFSLQNGVRLAQDVQYRAPTFPGFAMTNAPEQTPYNKDGYQVQEVRYILTAQTEGNYTFNPAVANIGLPQNGRRDIFGMTFGTTWKQIASNSLEIEVLPQAKQSDIIGDFTLASTLDSQEVKANKPVNLHVTIQGKGSLEGFEFPKYEIDGVTVYGDDAKLETSVVDGVLHSTYTKSFAFIAQEDFTIPARTFSMMSPKDHTLKTLKVDAYDVHIKKSIQAPLKSEQSPTHGVVQTQAKQDVVPQEKVAEAQATQEPALSWWMLVLAFVLGMVLMLMVKWIRGAKRVSAKSYNDDEALKILYAHVSEDANIEEMVRKLYAKKRGDKTVQIDKKALKAMLQRFE